MHDGHDHHHDHDQRRLGHNGQRPAAPMADAASAARRRPHRAGALREPDLDLVETAFVEPSRGRPTRRASSASPAFRSSARPRTERVLSLLRVEVNQTTDIGALTPHLGGAGHRYDPLPAKMTSRRQRLALGLFRRERAGRSVARRSKGTQESHSVAIATDQC